MILKKVWKAKPLYQLEKANVQCFRTEATDVGFYNVLFSAASFNLFRNVRYTHKH